MKRRIWYVNFMETFPLWSSMLKMQQLQTQLCFFFALSTYEKNEQTFQCIDIQESEKRVENESKKKNKFRKYFYMKNLINVYIHHSISFICSYKLSAFSTSFYQFNQFIHLFFIFSNSFYREILLQQNKKSEYSQNYFYKLSE